MVQSNSPVWANYVKHVLLWEGKTSKDPDDTSAAKCAPFKGAYHTNKGVTYCTFKSLAAKLGITPVTYEKFVKLTDYEVGLFIYEFYKKNQPERLPDSIALALVEARWLSGDWSVKHLQKLVGTPQTGILDETTIQLTNKMDETTLFAAYVKERDRFLKSLKNAPKYYNGWSNRLTAFQKLGVAAQKKKPNRKIFIDAFNAGLLFYNS